MINKRALLAFIFGACFIYSNYSWAQKNADFPLPGILQLGTTHFQHKDLKSWYAEHSKTVMYDHHKWGDNAIVEQLLQLDTLGHHEALISYNRMADKTGLLAFNYYEEFQEDLFNKSSDVDSVRLVLDGFIKSEKGINYTGEYSLFIGALGEKGEIRFQQSKISSHPHLTMDESTALKKDWLDRWIKQNKPSYKIQETFKKLDKTPLPKIEEPSESVMEIGLPEDLLAGQVRYGKFDVGYGSFKNLEWGGFFMESLERGALKFYAQEASTQKREIEEKIRSHKKAINRLKVRFEEEAPLFTSALQNPAEDWYERTYYSLNQEDGMEIVLQIQVTFVENRNQDGTIKEIKVIAGDQANYRDYCRYILFQKKVPIPLAPVYEVGIDWENRKIKK